MRIREAIDHYNANKDDGAKRMNQQRLASIVMPNSKQTTAIQLLSRWSNGKMHHLLRASHIKRMCEALKVDADFLFKGMDPKGHEIDEMDVGGLLKVLNCTGLTPNKVLGINKMR